MAFDSISTTKSKLQVTIASTLVDVPGIQNFTPDSGEEGTFDAADIASDYDTLKPTRVGGGGTVSGSALLDPLDTVHMFLQDVKNKGGAPTGDDYLDGSTTISETGVLWPFKGILTKWAPKGERKNGWMVDFEFKLYERMTMNVAAP